MIKNITRKIGNYFFARDIYRAHKAYDNKVREAVMGNKELYACLNADKRLKNAEVLACSAFPNIIDCLGIGLAIHYNNPWFAAAGGLVAEGWRISLRHSAKESLKNLNKGLDFIIDVEDLADRMMHHLDILKDRLKKINDEDNEGEEWKSGNSRN